ncbi:MAG: DUF5678 domain-containing protein [Abditibacteriales bacterium]|nr:DUF5678 domain-containing protein [Abditibacteriales bacterium]MDW8368133.1 DUF5678 domain-containing protein [Abditibacteriales bacterium]
MRRKETLQEAHERNQQAFLRLRKKLAETHPGQWVVLVGGQVVALAPALEELRERLDQMGPCLRYRTVFEVGEPHPLSKAKLPIYSGVRLCA